MGEVPDQRDLSAQTGEKGDCLWHGPTQNMQKFEMFMGHLEKAPGQSHIRADIIPGEQRGPLSCLWPALAQNICLFSSWALWSGSHVAHGLEEGGVLLLSCPPGNSLDHVFSHSLAQEHMITRPRKPCGLHIQAPGRILKWTGAGNKLSCPDGDQDHVAAACRLWRTMFQVEQDFRTLVFVLALLRIWLDFFLGRKRRWSLRWESHSPRSHWTWNKTCFLLHQHLSASWVWLLLWQAAKPLFCVWLH